MSKQLDVEQLKVELVGFPGKTFPIYCTELTGLIERLEAAESKLAEFHAWAERYKAVVNGSQDSK